MGSSSEGIVLVVEDASCFHGAGSVVTELGVGCVTDDTCGLRLREGRRGHSSLFLLLERSHSGSLGSLGE